jgi:hypothetical protein
MGFQPGFALLPGRDFSCFFKKTVPFLGNVSKSVSVQGLQYVVKE